jgi:cell wall-associated NlpC family hydrolase
MSSTIGGLRRGARFVLLVLAIVAAALVPPAGAWAQDATLVTFGDAGVRAAVVRQLVDTGQIPAGSDGTTITPADMLALTTLSAAGRGIVRLDGLESAANLVSLDLHANRIADIAPIAGLASLKRLDIAGNKIDVTPGSPAANMIAPIQARGGTVGWQPQVASLSALSSSPARPLYRGRVTFTARLVPAGAALVGTATLSLYHLETRTVARRVRGTIRKVSVGYWRLRGVVAGRGSSSGTLSFSTRLTYAGRWQARMTHAASPLYQPCAAGALTVTVQDPRIEAAIRWARARLGSHSWDHYCLRFASDAYAFGSRTSVVRYRSAHQAAAALRATAHPSANAPRGMWVFYRSWCGGAELGHVGISLGNGTMISDFGSAGVCIRPIRCGLRYLGWAAPPLSPRITDQDTAPR